MANLNNLLVNNMDTFEKRSGVKGSAYYWKIRNGNASSFD
jgi:hypothetical protein